MRDGFELLEREKPACALQRVDCAEDARKRPARGGIFFERHEIALELIEVLSALDEELFSNVVH